MIRLLHCTWFLALCSTFDLEAQDIVEVAVFDEHEKYVAASNAYGISWQLIELAANHANIQLEIEESTWHASLSRIKAQKLDWAYAAIKTDEREQWANFSAPLVSGGSGIFTRLDNPVSTFEEIDLENSVVGVTINSVQEALARELGFKNIYSSGQRPQLYNMLNAKRVDYLFFGKSIISYYCAYFAPDRKPGCMKQVGNTYLARNMHILVDKRNKRANRLIERLNASILAISQTDEAKQLFNDYNLDSKQHQKWTYTLTSPSEQSSLLSAPAK